MYKGMSSCMGIWSRAISSGNSTNSYISGEGKAGSIK
jgi:hypothetical protein